MTQAQTRQASEMVKELATNVRKVFVGRTRTVEQVLLALLAQGHVLLGAAAVIRMSLQTQRNGGVLKQRFGSILQSISSASG